MEPVSLFEKLTDYGLPGIVIAILSMLLWKLVNMYNDVQEKRIAEAQEMTRVTLSNTSALERLKEVIMMGRKDV